MAHEVVSKLIITNLSGAQLKLEKRTIDEDKCLVFDIDGTTIFLDNYSDVAALIKYAKDFLSVSETSTSNLVR